MRALKSIQAACAALPFFALSGPAFAADSSTDKGIVSELRLGVYDHDSGLFGERYETSKPDVNMEILFNGPDWLQWMAQPRINIGGNLNTGSGTSVGYAGLVWNFDLTDAFFIEGGFGAGIHDGQTDKTTADQLDLGCRVMFHENASIGYRLTESASVMVTVDHISSAGICTPNPGITDLGVRLGYSF